MASVRLLPLPELYILLKSQLYTAAGALFFNGICLLLFSYAVFFLLKTRTRASMMFLTLAVILVLFALAQMMIDVAMAAVLSQAVHLNLANSTSGQILKEQKWVSIMIVREGLLATNNAITDSLFLYRCASIWAGSPWYRIVLGVCSFLIFTTLIIGYVVTFIVNNDSILLVPYGMALATNIILLGLTAGRIWRKGRQATVVLGDSAGRRYNTTLEIICESSLLYVINVFIYMISVLSQTFGPVPNIAWGALAQVVNIVPMMIMVRVGMTKTYEGSDTRGAYAMAGTTLYEGSSAGRTLYRGSDAADATIPLASNASSMGKSSGQYSRSELS
ncbi:hypothetical protein DFH09DRAFT_1164508 [Mycena vulgaris]|nr:hypothetical protein DFH09DRAFT_1164508 [Mycena vulgaris]